jgi:hypothetical protein
MRHKDPEAAGDTIHNVKIDNNTFKNNGAGTSRAQIFFEGDFDACNEWVNNLEITNNLFFKDDALGVADSLVTTFGISGFTGRRFGSITFSGNTYGDNVGVGGSDPNSIDDTDFYTFPAGAGTNCDDFTLSGNTNDTSTDSTTSPGWWEFTAPTNNGDSATDAGSGMGATSRWPFTIGAMAQGHDGSNNYSEVELYANRGDLSSWSEIRFADVDHNWSALATNSQSNNIKGITIE